ncbi:MAG TPA: lipoyl(octanoyl) transferase LipB [Gemmataceae bacterium]|jgi:lipoyl(octanoyl) transferase|nr:lipoyl(octanoyl) transferase LipB [Gemmataceae bacterium]
MGATSHQPARPKVEPSLRVYLLGSVDFDDALSFQRRLAYEIAGDRESGALILCEHRHMITIGRQGSWRHVLLEPGELRARRWPVRWVNRGGGCILHAPGQVAIYPIVALDRLDLGIDAYLHRLQQVLVAGLDDFSIRGETRLGQADVWVGPRPIAALGIAVRNWVSYYGGVLNVNPDLALFRGVHVGGPAGGTMTSVERERRGPLRPALVRERLVEHFAARFGFSRISLYHDHPSLRRKARSDALAPSS